MADDIICPECGGQLQYWKEYLSQKTQLISLDGKLNKKVTTSKPESCYINLLGAQRMVLCRQYKNKCRWITYKTCRWRVK